jgi:hypothetical protein
MTIDAWLQAAKDDADRRGLPELKPQLEALARATAILRAADFNDEATGQQPEPAQSGGTAESNSRGDQRGESR